MTNQEIVLEMERRQYDALQSSLQLRGSSVEAEMQKRLEQCYLDMVPAKKRRRSPPPRLILIPFSGSSLRERQTAFSWAM